jgi:hypothetical protein
MTLRSRGASGVALVVLGTLLYVPALVPDTGWLGYLVVLPATLLLTYGTLLIGRDTDGRVV